MRKTIQYLVGILTAVALYMPSSSQAQAISGWLFDPPRPGGPSSVVNQQDNPAGTPILTLDAWVNFLGSELNVKTPTSSSYSTYLEAYCTTGWQGAISRQNVTGTTAGDIQILCDFVNGSFGTAAFWFGDT